MMHTREYYFLNIILLNIRMLFAPFSQLSWQCDHENISGHYKEIFFWVIIWNMWDLVQTEGWVKKRGRQKAVLWNQHYNSYFIGIHSKNTLFFNYLQGYQGHIHAVLK